MTPHTCRDNEIFVFGSNYAGRHGKGAALTAKRMYGAKYGEGVGHHGRSYAIPTKDQRLRVLSLGVIRTYVNEFLDYAEKHPELRFFLTRIGCGLAGYEDDQISSLFMGSPANVRKPIGW